jgi:uncharacterized protein YndB with AHSA1/START domain
MFKKLCLGFLLVLVLAVGGLAIAIAMQPNEIRVERKIVIAAPPSAVFPHVNNFRKWKAWSPWEKLDPAAQNTFPGPEEGEGAIFQWAGNSKVGKGQMTILESRPNELVRIKLDFIEPMEDTSLTHFHLKGDAAQTELTWNMHGEHSLMSKAMCVFMDMEKMVGDSFEEGLANIKAIAEKSAK